MAKFGTEKYLTFIGINFLKLIMDMDIYGNMIMKAKYYYLKVHIQMEKKMVNEQIMMKMEIYNLQGNI